MAAATSAVAAEVGADATIAAAPTVIATTGPGPIGTAAIRTGTAGITGSTGTGATGATGTGTAGVGAPPRAAGGAER